MKTAVMIRFFGVFLSLCFIVSFTAVFVYAAPTFEDYNFSKSLIPKNMKQMNEYTSDYSFWLDFGEIATKHYTMIDFPEYGNSLSPIYGMSHIDYDSRLNNNYIEFFQPQIQTPYLTSLGTYMLAYVPYSIVDTSRIYELSFKIYKSKPDVGLSDAYFYPFDYNIIVFPIPYSSEVLISYIDIETSVIQSSKNAILTKNYSDRVTFDVKFPSIEQINNPHINKLNGYLVGFWFVHDELNDIIFNGVKSLSKFDDYNLRYFNGSVFTVNDITLTKTFTSAEVEQSNQLSAIKGWFVTLANFIEDSNAAVTNKLEEVKTSITTSISDMSTAVTDKLDDVKDGIVNAGAESPDLNIDKSFIDDVREFMDSTSAKLDDFTNTLKTSGADAKNYISKGSSIFVSFMGTVPSIVITLMTFGVLFVVVRKTLGR